MFKSAAFQSHGESKMSQPGGTAGCKPKQRSPPLQQCNAVSRDTRLPALLEPCMAWLRKKDGGLISSMRDNACGYTSRMWMFHDKWPGRAGHVWTMAQDRWASLVLITALQRVDDTSLLRSVIIAELLVRQLCSSILPYHQSMHYSLYMHI